MNSELHSRTPALKELGTLVGWMACLAVGILGSVLPNPTPSTAGQSSAGGATQLLNVRLTEAARRLTVAAPATPVSESAPAERSTAPAAVPKAPTLPAAPALVPVAPASPAIAFAVPTSELTPIVEASQAGHTSQPEAKAGGGAAGGAAGDVGQGPSSSNDAAAGPVATRLTFGQGEGNQPPPQYPRQAILAREQGTVGLRFTVGEDGRVLWVQVVVPCRWPLLNQAAADAVRDTWHFPPGPRRLYEVPIEFQLHQ
jgi:periplasmic protein TonB